MTLKTATIERAIEQARALLGVSRYSSKARIKRQVWLGDYYSTDAMQREVYNQREAARDLLLRSYVLDSSDEAKAARKQEKLDDKVRAKFRSEWYHAHWALQVAPEYKSKHHRLEKIWTKYTKLPYEARLAFIKKSEHVFDLTATEEKVAKKYQKEQMAKLRAECQKKRQEEKDTRRRELDEGYKTIEVRKIVEPQRWGAAIHESSHSVVATALGFYVTYAEIGKREGEGGHMKVFQWQKPTMRQDILSTVYILAAAEAEMKLGVASFYDIAHGQTKDYQQQREHLTEFCHKYDGNPDAVIAELRAYARILVNHYWKSIIAVAERLMIRGRLESGEIRRIHWGVVKKEKLGHEPPMYPFRGTLAAVLAPFPEAVAA